MKKSKSEKLIIAHKLKNWGFQKGVSTWNSGKNLSEEHKKKLSMAHQGKDPWNKGKKYTQITGSKNPRWSGGKPKCLDCGKQLAAYTAKYCLSHAHREERHHAWKGKHSNRIERMRLMGRIEYKQWRQAIFTRDNYTCQLCGKRGGDLEADHIKPWLLYPELRYNIDNGRVLCIPCHKRTPTWGAKIHYFVEGA